MLSTYVSGQIADSFWTEKSKKKQKEFCSPESSSTFIETDEEKLQNPQQRIQLPGLTNNHNVWSLKCQIMFANEFKSH